MARKAGTFSGVPRRVVVALRMAGIAGQDKLTGIFEHLGAERRWQLIIYRTKAEFTAATVRSELARGVDGFLVGIPDTDDALSEIAATTVPTVVLNVAGGGVERRRKGIAFVKSDSAALGREAANELLKQGIYRSYGYVGYRSEEDWSRERGAAFRDTLAAAGFIGRMFDRTHYRDRIEDKAKLAEWLRDLPKPCGILAACDDRAFELLDVASEIGLKVPAEIGILGVNNDPILCENAVPRLSSVQPDFIEEGRLAAEFLDKMMSDVWPADARRTHYVGIRAIVHRDSTVPQSEAGRLVQRILAYINRNAVKGIGVEDVAKRFKVSRSLVELRFRELQGESVYEAMLRVRLDEVKRRLRQTDEPIAEITAACGWENPAPPKVLFRKRFGITMRQYRNSHGRQRSNA